ncbi:hypothetical protein CSW98_02645 [Vibrio sp. HA2012]|uniref:lipopolysaccharide biosynthesis protein n=1 Tax=Vibrio sp. HA2012 TaxID=1971595 RepID=UPI000C2CE214|nr:oligosaccharide flippase family protein [Vibrio sp. HA2012]PJC88036.1 hypothetical protein CSW98_02645 [Vibrio sp. HA2012]
MPKISISLKSDLLLSIFAFIIKLLAGISGYFLFVLFAKMMGTVEYGYFSYIFSILMLIALVSNLGQQTFIIKEVPKSKLLSDKNREYSAYIFSMVMSSTGVLIGVMIYSIICLMIIKTSNYKIIFYGSMFIALFSFSQTTVGYLRVQDKTLLAIGTRDLIWRIISAVIFVFILYLEHSKAEIPLGHIQGIIAMSASLFLILMFHLFQIKKYIRHNFNGNKFVINPRPWVKVSLGLTLIALISNSDSYLYTIILGGILSEFEIGLLFSSLKTVELINVFLMAVTLVVSPQLSKLVALGDVEKLQRKCNVAIVLQTIPVLFATVVLFGWSEDILVIFDPSYSSYSLLLRLLSIGMFVNALTGATVLLLQVGGMHWQHVRYQGGSILISSALLPLFVMLWGVNGVAISFILSKCLWNILAIKAIRKKLKIDPSILALVTPSRSHLGFLKSDLLNLR